MEGLLSLILLLCAQYVHLQRMDSSPFPADSQFSMNINMPDVKPSVPDAYLCTAKKLDPRESYIVKYEPDVQAQTLHHMLLFGCKDIKNPKHVYPASWNCAHGDICVPMSIMYGWAKNAPPMELPPDVGFLIGGNSSIQYLVLQIHYAKPLSDGASDNSGLKLHLTTQRQRYITGIRLLLADSALIPPRMPKFHVDTNCKFDETYAIHPFAYRVHTHKLGVVVTGYLYNTINNSWTLLAKGNPQWPQAFYPMETKITITSNDILAARCTYNTTQMTEEVEIGSSANNEMCNLYLMYYTEYHNALAGQSPPCLGVQFNELVGNLPPGNDTPLPPNPELEQQAFGNVNHHHHTPITYHTFPDRTSSLGYSRVNRLNEVPSHLRVKPNSNGALNNEYMYKEAHGWPSKTLKFGQIAAVTIDHDGTAIIFHRGDHVWNELTFDYFHNYKLADLGPIKKPTIVHIDSVTGLLLKEWGQNFFYMPHGLSISPDSSFWVTDVAMHQVFQFSRKNLRNPVLTLGEKFIPGNDKDHFCKPASVAVSSNGEIYIADGYCNSRIVRFSADGKYLSQWGKQDHAFERNPPVGSFRIPHKIIIIEDHDLTCVADRENERIQCFQLVTGRFRFLIQREEFGGSLYSIAYAPEKGVLVAVCGEAVYKDHTVQAYVFNITDQKLLNVFSPESGSFTRPHDIAILPNGDEAFVCEIGPNLVWKFIRVYHKSTKKVLDTSPLLHESHSSTANQDKKTVALQKIKTDNKTAEYADDSTSFETSLIIMSLLAIPVLCLVVITIVVRLKRRGKLQQSYFGNLKGWWGGYRTPHPQDKFNLGNLLNPHKGFDRVSVEESDAEGEDGSDSDVEEYSAVARKT